MRSRDRCALSHKTKPTGVDEASGEPSVKLTMISVALAFTTTRVLANQEPPLRLGEIPK